MVAILILIASSAVGAGLASQGAGAANAKAYVAACPMVPAGTAHCDALVVADASGNPLASSTPPSTAYGPAQFHTAYGLPTNSLATSTQTIAIVDAYDDPNIASDLATYDSHYGLPCATLATVSGCFEKVNQAGVPGSYPKANSNWALEISLDVETAHQICQNCKILLVEANSSSMADLGTAENTAASMHANVISNSWGSSEYSGELSDQSLYFNHPGIAITVSSGDSGYLTEFPAASQYVTAVGGTTLNLNSDNSYKSEAAWFAGGSGCSAYILKPTWQVDKGCSHRTVVDVAADADPMTGAAVYDSVRDKGQVGWFQVGGTSLASPLIAGVYALAGNASSVTYGSSPYSAPSSSLHDVTTGSNGSCGGSYLCTAVTGYDGPTGMGTPKGLGAF